MSKWEDKSLKPKRCCAMGSYKCNIPMFIKGRVQGIDYCISHIIAALNAANIVTVASCCGHGKFPGTIMLEGGQEIVLFNDSKERDKILKKSK